MTSVGETKEGSSSKTGKPVCTYCNHCTVYIYAVTQMYTNVDTGCSVGALAGAVAATFAGTVLLYTAVLGVVIAAVIICQKKK